MFERALEAIDFVAVSDDDLESVITKDIAGNRISLRDLISLSGSRDLCTVFGIASNPDFCSPKPVGTLTEEEKSEISLLHLEDIPSNISLHVTGYGSFSVDQLHDEIVRKTYVGNGYIRMTMQYCVFMEEAVKDGKIMRKEKQSFALPPFDF